MDYINQSSYFDSNNLKRFILYRNIRTNKIRSINSSFVNMDVSNADIKNLNVHHDITLNNNPYLPIGIVLPYATTTAPEGWLVCNGQEVSKTTYASLWNVIGTTFGTSVLPDNFILPDLRGRVIVGNGTGIGLTARSIGDISGAETHTLTENEMPSHNHTGTTNSSGNHSHTYQDVATTEAGGSGTNDKIGLNSPDNDNGLIYRGADGNLYNTPQNLNTSTNGDHTHTFTTNNTGGGQPHNNMPPFAVLNYIIKYRV
jgi:microcystin-dependent protein